ncbi:MAG: hypothetical protein PHR43_04165 [Dehalococcoidales bacterium]|nr:hypothetical protein [Dehalococcoidales bacterium]
MGEFPVINKKKCNGCGLCVDICTCHGLIMVGSVVEIVPTVECDWCTKCEAICPAGAISCSYEIIIEG